MISCESPSLSLFDLLPTYFSRRLISHPLYRVFVPASAHACLIPWRARNPFHGVCSWRLRVIRPVTRVMGSLFQREPNAAIRIWNLGVSFQTACPLNPDERIYSILEDATRNEGQA